jgi:hypothetical protein
LNKLNDFVNNNINYKELFKEVKDILNGELYKYYKKFKYIFLKYSNIPEEELNNFDDEEIQCSFRKEDSSSLNGNIIIFKIIDSNQYLIFDNKNKNENNKILIVDEDYIKKKGLDKKIERKTNKIDFDKWLSYI